MSLQINLDVGNSVFSVARTTKSFSAARTFRLLRVTAQPIRISDQTFSYSARCFFPDFSAHRAAHFFHFSIHACSGTEGGPYEFQGSAAGDSTPAVHESHRIATFRIAMHRRDRGTWLTHLSPLSSSCLQWKTFAKSSRGQTSRRSSGHGHLC